MKWKCAAPPNITRMWRDVVTGWQRYEYKFDNCYLARENMSLDPGGKYDGQGCGLAGAWFLKYEPVDFAAHSRKIAHERGADALLDELEKL